MQIKTIMACAARAGFRHSGLPLLFRYRLLPLVAMLGVLLPADAVATSKRRPAAQDHSSAAGTNGTRKLSPRATSRTSRRHRRPRVSDYRRRIAKIHLEPDRVKEIQGALARAGYLHQEPNGQWDAETHAAMERYQQDSGFAATGLPDARSIMKLGLGPHPLPPAADPNTAKTTADSALAGRSQNTPGVGSDRPE
jgi:peptidoglycan hydrolase-like protein with peptidoglycan-binding domain